MPKWHILKAVLSRRAMARSSTAVATGDRVRRPVDDPVYIRVIETMIATRKAAGIRQTELAAKLGQPQSYVSKVESRERRVDVGEYVAWMRALGANPVGMLDQILVS